MRFNGGDKLSWSRIERILSGRAAPEDAIESRGMVDAVSEASPRALPPGGGGRGEEGGDLSLCFAELHAVSSYSFLNGASDPEDLVSRAVELGLSGLAVVDRDGFYGVAAFAEAATQAGLPTVFGAELSLDDGVLTVLCRGPEGYRRLSHLITDAHMATGEKDRVAYPAMGEVARRLGGECVVLADYPWIERMDDLIRAFGKPNVVIEYDATLVPEDADHHAALDAARSHLQLPAIVSARPAAARVEDAPLAGAKRALARRQSIAAAESELHPMGAPWLRSAAQVRRMVPGRDELLAHTVELARECAFTLDLVAPRLPDFPTPVGHTEQSWLCALTRKRARERYASRSAEVQSQAAEQIAHELEVIGRLGFPGYFLIVDDIVGFCREQNILCQGRGSAANSAVCFSLGITNAEPISAGLLFERFLSPERDGPPDIDLDIESTRREEVIQYVYRRYGRDNAALVANVITYRYKGAIRDAARALGFPPGAADGWAKGLSSPPDRVEKLAKKFLGQPRHLGIHSGGMVICDRPIADVVPVEWARMKDRSVVQWDKDACAAAGLVKFDLLGLGMLEALHHMIDLVRDSTGEEVKLWDLDLTEPGVYEMLSRGDAVGVFQVESRAQLATLPRLKPQRFFDLVVEVALIRPGPIQGGSVHPYLRRRDGLEPVTFEHPVLEKSLGKTLGIPLFQEQLMQIAVDAAGFSGGEADQLRRAMGAKRSSEKMAALHQKFVAGCAHTSGISGPVAENLWAKIMAFAAYGFPESHSQSFASLVFFSAWMKLHYPAQFCAGLLRAQPMGFYAPQSLTADARRHGITILPIDVAHSDVAATVPTPGTIRLGLGLVKGLGDEAAGRVVHARERGGAFTGVADVARRADLTVAHTEALGRAGALESLGLSRRGAIWQAGVAATEKAGMLPGMSAITAPALPGMSAFEVIAADLAATGVTHGVQPVALLRDRLDNAGVIPANRLLEAEDGSRIRVAGVVTHRQRPNTAAGVTFMGLEDETGLINVMVSPGLWRRQKVLARTAGALMVRGIVQNASGAATIVADRLDALELAAPLGPPSRDFR